MPTQLHQDIRFHRGEIGLVSRTIAKVQAGSGTRKADVLRGLNETLKAHTEVLTQLEKLLHERDAGGDRLQPDERTNASPR